MVTPAANREERVVLVVDDDVDFRDIVAATLARNGMTVMTADSADDAVRQCQQRRPALIVMDVQMPGRGGIQACAGFKQAPSTADVPVILMSAHWRDEHQLVRAFDSGADDVLAKEQSKLELMARVHSVLAVAAARRRLLRGDTAALAGFLALCAACKRIRNEDNEWEDSESYLRRALGREITHGICPGCRDRLYGADSRR